MGGNYPFQDINRKYSAIVTRMTDVVPDEIMKG